MTLHELMVELDLPESARGPFGEPSRGPGRPGGDLPREPIPRTLRAALEAAAALGDEEGVALVLEAGLGEVGAGSDAAIRAALRAPERLLEAARAWGRHRWPVWELAGADPTRRPALSELEARLLALIRPALEARWHEDVSVEVREAGAELRVRVRSSGPPRRGPRGDVRLIVCDPVIFDRPRGRLRLATEAAARQSAYRQAFGEALFGDPGWFSGPALTLAPFLASPGAALRPTRTVSQARLAGVELAGDAPGDVLHLLGGDVLGWLSRLDLGDQLDRLLAVTLDLQLDLRPARVEIRPPHLVLYDRPREEPDVRAFLAERGLLGGAPRS